ncbi:MAG: sigma-70 family RNA polymerase sigma factor [Akkermansiaceae bacterium]|nr:sigma-70 family RNA polymerase sigma factor [Armatimonadota bacterium]
MSTATSILSDEAPSVLSLHTGDLWAKLFGKTKSVTIRHEPAYLALAKTGDENALAQFYAEYKEPVWRLCRRLLRREADAEDVLQTTFVKAFSALPQFRGDASLKTWLFRIAVNEAITLLRRRDSTCLSTTDEEIQELAAPDTMSDTERVAVRTLIASLKPDFRTVIVLRYWEELSYEEIASVLSLPLPSVKMRLHRAKEAFRELYVGKEKTR